MNNSQVALELYEVADLLELKGSNPFRIRAYRNAARVVENLPRPILELVDEGTILEELPGIGKDLAEKILYTTENGKFPGKREIEKGIPRGVLALLKIPGLGPKRVSVLHTKLRVRSLEDLERACRRERIQKLRGFGKKTEERILEEIEKLKVSVPHRTKLVDAESVAEHIKSYIEGLSGVTSVTLAGSFRRRKETVADLDIVVTANRQDRELMERILSYEGNMETLARGATRGTMLIQHGQQQGLQVDVRLVPNESFGAALLYFTGSKTHNIALRGLALKAKLKINEYGVFRGKRHILGKTEEEIYRCLGLSYIEPELRENEGEIEAARKGELPELISVSDIRGDLNCHTIASDGIDSIEAMADGALKLGYQYLAIADHSQSPTRIHGLDERRLLAQIKEINQLNKQFKPKGLTILKSAEVAVLEDGTLAFPTNLLSKLDFAIAAIHSHYDLPSAKQTDRLLRAISNPCVRILAHPLARVIGEREPIEVDFDKILKVAKTQNCLLEINANPDRLDLPNHLCRLSANKGVKLVISTSAQQTSDLSHLKYGVDVARRGWLTKANTLNTSSLKDLLRAMRIQ